MILSASFINSNQIPFSFPHHHSTCLALNIKRETLALPKFSKFPNRKLAKLLSLRALWKIDYVETNKLVIPVLTTFSITTFHCTCYIKSYTICRSFCFAFLCFGSMPSFHVFAIKSTLMPFST